ncbi:mediator of RNA polymerase II transcription subunit 11 [Leptopilina boulardi]|uniref:mediator of RNA polymerase II transcription subunit 11 n=1 Tax=Leptopilina boulardi TaxID=63433 RepID=UPI0021F67EE1|nr:mediator of RNA polymerase II transcription subunit 11 [Leptopilina boulardi]
MTPPMERIQILESIEKDIIACLQNAGQAFMELSKEKSSLKHAESHTHNFLKSLSAVESKLSEQINYLTQVSTGQPHEGSGYASQKVLQMAWHRLEHVRSRVNELERMRNKHNQGRSSMRTNQSQMVPVNSMQQPPINATS